MVRCSCVHACVRLEFGCLLPSLHSVHFELLRCAHKRIVNIMKVYIEKNYVEMELIRFRKKKSDFIDFTNFEVGIGPILSQPMCSLLSVMSRQYSVLKRRACRTFRNMTTSAQNVGPSANSALIRYSSLRV